MEIRFKRVSRINAIIVHHYYQCISPAGRQFFSDNGNELRGRPPIPATMQNTHSRPTRNIFWHFIRPLLANRKFRYGQDDLIRRRRLSQQRANRRPQVADPLWYRRKRNNHTAIAGFLAACKGFTDETDLSPMLSTTRKQTLETEHTQNDKGRANQRKH